MKENKYLNEKGECNCPKPTFWINGIGRVAYNDQNRFHAEMLEKADKLENEMKKFDCSCDGVNQDCCKYCEYGEKAYKLRGAVKRCLHETEKT